MIETTFYILGSIFLGLAIIFLVLVGYYWIEILRNFSRMSKNFSDMSRIVREKVEKTSDLIAGIFTVIEKISQIYKKKKYGEKSKK